jgi:hypothetical protein
VLIGASIGDAFETSSITCNRSSSGKSSKNAKTSTSHFTAASKDSIASPPVGDIAE